MVLDDGLPEDARGEAIAAGSHLCARWLLDVPLMATPAPTTPSPASSAAVPPRDPLARCATPIVARAAAATSGAHSRRWFAISAAAQARFDRTPIPRPASAASVSRRRTRPTTATR